MAIDRSTIHAARIPWNALVMLARYRTLSSFQVTREQGQAWLHGERSLPVEVLQTLLAIPGATFFTRRNHQWYRVGSFLPTAEVMDLSTSVFLGEVLIPEPIEPIEPTCPDDSHAPIRTVPGPPRDRPIPTDVTALLVPLTVLQTWIDAATNGQIEACQGLWTDQGVWIQGPQLPWFAEATRFWGASVWLPLGYHAEPDWGEAILRAAARVTADEILVCTPDQNLRLPRQRFQPLRRAILRQAVTEAGA